MMMIDITGMIRVMMLWQLPRQARAPLCRAESPSRRKTRNFRVNHECFDSSRGNSCQSVTVTVTP
jgi:hypothetical protein